MQIINPKDGAVLQDVAETTPEQVGAAVARARAAQRAWQEGGYAPRRAALLAFRDIVAGRSEQLARVLADETGKPLRQGKNELSALLGRIDFFLEHAPAVLAPRVVHQAEGLQERIALEPLGVIANVSAWNYPYFVGSNVFVPALLTGNAVVYKPSELATLTGLAIERALHEAGVPKDVFVCVPGAAPTGAALVSAPVDGVFFTGSVATGKKIAAAVASRLVRLQLELGGKDPVYVSDDVDVDSAAEAVADGAFYNTGQSCCAVERVYVHSRVWDDFLRRFVEVVEGFVVGDPLDASTYIGPLARREAQIEHLERQIQDALDKGARLLCGGGRADGPGFFFRPTVLVDVDHRMQVMTEESFGPVIGLMKVDSDEQALALMNETRYGLTAGVYARDQVRAERLLAELDVGSAYWNCCDRVSPRLPWSGRRDSGVGCTLSTYGIEAMLKWKAWHLRG